MAAKIQKVEQALNRMDGADLVTLYNNTFALDGYPQIFDIGDAFDDNLISPLKDGLHQITALATVILNCSIMAEKPLKVRYPCVKWQNILLKRIIHTFLLNSGRLLLTPKKNSGYLWKPF